MYGNHQQIRYDLTELRQQAHYWKAQHSRALERIVFWKEKSRQLEKVVHQHQATITNQREQIEALKATVALLQQQVFGRKSERTKGLEPESKEDKWKVSDFSDRPPEHGRKRGKQPGAKGYGRKRRLELPTEEIPHDLREDEKRCPYCSKPYVKNGAECSDEIHWEVKMIRKVHKRLRYRPACDCQGTPVTVTAPPPAKLIPKGMFSIGFWTHLLLEKFLFQRPLYRVRQVLELEGLSVSQGTLTGGLNRIGELVQPLYAQILERSRATHHWQMDETGWMVFEEIEGKVGYRWWLWVVITKETCAYLMEPSRSSEVVRRHLGQDAVGIINADRYSAYKALGGQIEIAYCWSHIRRDFIRIRDGYRRLRHWGEAWVGRINDLFEQNERRLKVLARTDAFRSEDNRLRSLVSRMAERWDRELANSTLHPAQKKVLVSLRNHWKGATLFVDHPEIPMDNNESERRLRNPVCGRKNYYGSGSIWSGMFTASMFTIFQTLLVNHIDPQKFLEAYFEACAQNEGNPPEDLNAFLPWKMSKEQKAAWRYPRGSP